MQKIPMLEQAEKIFESRKNYNDLGWVNHSVQVANAAKVIAENIVELQPERAYILGLFHDIGRSFTKGEMQHVTEGYNYMMQLGYSDCARICYTHSFQVKSLDSYSGKHDCEMKDYENLKRYLDDCEYDDYDKLIQLCDAMVAASGCCVIEKRLVDVVMRHGFKDSTLAKWKAIFDLKDYFQNKVGKNLYSVLPNVVENTFR